MSALPPDLVPVTNAFYVPTERIEPNPFQPRQHFGEAELNELADSIREQGQLQPVLLRPHPKEPGCYQLVSGERRLRACQKIGRSEISALIRSLTDLEARQIALQENIQRKSLTDWEEARGLEDLWRAYEMAGEPMGKKSFARKINMSVSYVSNRLDALGYHEDVQRLMATNRGVLSSAKVINSIEDDERRGELIQKVEDGASYLDVLAEVQKDENEAKAEKEVKHAPDKQTEKRIELQQTGEGGGGMISRGEVVTGGNKAEANREALRAASNLEAWIKECDDKTHEKITELARRILRGDLSR